MLECDASGIETNAVMRKNVVMNKKKEGTATEMPAAVPSLVRRGLII